MEGKVLVEICPSSTRLPMSSLSSWVGGCALCPKRCMRFAFSLYPTRDCGTRERWFDH